MFHVVNLEFKEIVDQEAVDILKEVFFFFEVLFRVLDMLVYLWIYKKEATIVIISKNKLTPEHPLTLFFMKTLRKIIILKQKEER